jgi:hypothetical protein
MKIRHIRLSNRPPSHATRTASLGALAWLLLTLLPVQLAYAQGTVIFGNSIPAGRAEGQTTHVWGPSTINPNLSLVGLGSNDSPSGTTPFAASGMTLIGANGLNGQYGAATTFAQLLGAAGSVVPESSLVPVGQTATFRTGSAVGIIAWPAGSPYTLTGIPADAPSASFEVVASDNSSGLYSTWSQASVAWTAGVIAAGKGGEFTQNGIGGSVNPAPYLSDQMSFNLYFIPEPSACALAGLGAGVLLAWRRRG